MSFPAVCIVYKVIYQSWFSVNTWNSWILKEIVLCCVNVHVNSDQISGVKGNKTEADNVIILEKLPNFRAAEGG